MPALRGVGSIAAVWDWLLRNLRPASPANWLQFVVAWPQRVERCYRRAHRRRVPPRSPKAWGGWLASVGWTSSATQVVGSPAARIGMRLRQSIHGSFFLWYQYLCCTFRLFFGDLLNGVHIGALHLYEQPAFSASASCHLRRSISYACFNFGLGPEGPGVRAGKPRRCLRGALINVSHGRAALLVWILGSLARRAL